MTLVVDRFYALDLDRTLIDTMAVYRQLTEHLDSGTIKAQLDDDRCAVEASGGSFDVGDGLIRVVGEATAQQLLDEFAHQMAPNSQQFFLPGTHQLIAAIKSSPYQFGIITTGGLLWQSTKLKCVGLDGYPHLIVATKFKGRLIKSWLEAQQLPPEFGGQAACEVVLVDDKAVSFRDLPALGARGYCVQPASEELLPSQVGDLPAGVKWVTSLHEVIQAEQL